MSMFLLAAGAVVLYALATEMEKEETSKIKEAKERELDRRLAELSKEYEERMRKEMEVA